MQRFQVWFLVINHRPVFSAQLIHTTLKKKVRDGATFIQMKTVHIQIQPTIRQIGGKISLSSSNQCYVTNLQVRFLVIKHQPAAEAWWWGLCNIEHTIIQGVFLTGTPLKS